MLSRKFAAAAVAVVLLSSCAHASRALTQSLTTDITYVTGTDPKGAKVTIQPNHVWTWCGFNSMEKLTADVTADGEISLYISAKSVVKNAKLASSGLPGYDNCEAKDCMRKASGKLIKYNRCVAVGNFASSTPVQASIHVKSSRDSRISGIITAIVVGCVALVVCCILSLLCCLKKIACCCF